MKISANNIWMNYESKGKGRNFFLVHGAGDNLNMWYNQFPIFSQKFNVITYDIRGAGKTDSPKMDYTIPLFAEDLFELNRAIKRQATFSLDDSDTAGLEKILKEEGFHYLGYSLGGRIALELAIEHPEVVKSLILVSSGAGLTPPSPESAQRRQAIMELLDKKDMKKVAEMMTTSAFSPDFKSKNSKEFDKYKKVKEQSKAENLARIMKALSTANPPDLAAVKCPVLIIAGESDSYMGLEQAKQLQQAIAGSKLVTLPTGHAAPIELPDKFNSMVLEFLAGVEGK
ncbi:MAG: alpha/beta hydrolase [Dehalococcoidales bacterium]|nr:alpha/beta hydrolase [Dehalococcoidales bacterium]